MTDVILATLARLSGPHTRVAVEPVTGPEGLLGREVQDIRKAVPKRQAEFAAGRRAARRVLAALGQPDIAIPSRADRAPEWPKGFVGAITHDAGLAAAMVAEAASCGGVGLDIAEAAPFPSHLRDRILITDTERALGGLEARAVFSAKEALYKALYPSVRAFFGFDAAEIAPDLGAERFSARLTLALGPYPRGTTFTGGLAVAETRMLATLVLKT